MHRVLALLLAASALVLPCAAATRMDLQPAQTSGQGVGSVPVLTIPNAVIRMCGYPVNAMPCTNYAVTYSNATGLTACPSNDPLVLTGTNACVSSTDAQGNSGAWGTPGQLYAYTVTDPASGISYGPYSFTAPASNANIVSVKDYGAVGNGLIDDTTSVNAAISFAGANGTPVYFPAGRYCIASTIVVPVGMGNSMFYGSGYSSSFVPAGVYGCPGTFVGSKKFSGAALLSVFTLRDLQIDAGGLAAITTVVDLTRSPESSIRNRIDHVQITNVPNNATALRLNGCEDSTIVNSEILAPGKTGVTDVDWEVPTGNLHIFGSTWFDQTTLQYQVADIAGSTLGPIAVGNTAYSLVMTGDYLYSGPIGSAFGNFISSTATGFANIVINAGYVLGSNAAASTTASIAFQGNFGGYVQINGTHFEKASATSYVLFSSATTPASASAPTFALNGPAYTSGTVQGNPATGVSVQAVTQPSSQLLDAYFSGASPATQQGPIVIHSYPIRLTGIAAVSTISTIGCVTPMVVGVTGNPSTYLSLNNGAAQWGSFGQNLLIAAGAYPNISVITQATGCSSQPTNVQVTAEFQPQ